MAAAAATASAAVGGTLRGSETWTCCCSRAGSTPPRCTMVAAGVGHGKFPASSDVLCGGRGARWPSPAARMVHPRTVDAAATWDASARGSGIVKIGGVSGPNGTSSTATTGQGIACETVLNTAFRVGPLINPDRRASSNSQIWGCTSFHFCNIKGVQSRKVYGSWAQVQAADSESAPQKGRVWSQSQTTTNWAMSRRCLLSSILMSSTALSFGHSSSPALASSSYREYIDRLDGYIVSYPSGWIQVRGAGADVFFRDPVNLDENLVVEFSSPSSSRYKSVKDLGNPRQAAEKVLKQKITEFMSTRLGVRRESKIVSAKSRVGEDGRLYYDIEVDVKSYANTNQLAVMPADRVAKLEWSRRYLSTLGVENNRLYELRLQAPEKALAEEGTGLRQIMSSFQLVKLET